MYKTISEILQEAFPGGTIEYDWEHDQKVFDWCAINARGKWTKSGTIFYFDREEDLFNVIMMFGKPAPSPY